MKRWFIGLRPVKAILRLLYPHDGTCLKCGLPWSVVNPHFVTLDKLDKTEGFFAVCEHCHKTSTSEELEEAYQTLWHKTWRGMQKPFGYIVFRNAYMRDIKRKEHGK